MLTLGIETSCDETAFSIVEDSKKVLCSLVSSQINTHREFGGVVPEIASRKHLESLQPLFSKLLKESQISFSQIEISFMRDVVF